MTKFARQDASKSGKKRKRSATSTDTGAHKQLVISAGDDDEMLHSCDRNSEEPENEVNSEYDSESKGYSDSDEHLIDNMLSTDNVDHNETVNETVDNTINDSQLQNSQVKGR